MVVVHVASRIRNSPKRPNLKWRLQNNEKSESRLALGVFTDFCYRTAKQEALAATAAKISKSASKIVVPGTPKPAARVGQTPRRRVGI